MSQPNNSFGQDEIVHLRSQNDQLWKIIEKQRIMIQNLQKDNVRLSAERDGLQDQVNSLEKELSRKQRVASLLISPQTLREIAEQDDASSTPNSENAPSPIETLNIATAATATVPLASPMPPPRSPYRALKDKTEEFNSLDGVLAKKNLVEAEPESFVHSRPVEDTMANVNGRSSPASPAPGPHKYQQRKDSAPSTVGNKSSIPFVVPTPTKSSSSLEVRKNPRQRESILPPPRPVVDQESIHRSNSPTPASTHRHINNNTTLSHHTHTTTTTTTLTNNSNLTNNSTLYEKPESSSASRHNIDYEESIDDASLFDAKPASFMGNIANVGVKVVGSNIRPNDKGKEVVSFIISVGSIHEDSDDRNSFEERWRVEKLYSDFLALDSKLKAQRNRAIANRIGKLPDKALFSNNAPTKVDQRKLALEQYIQHLISLPLEDTSDLCEFLSTNVVDNKTYQLSGQKEGYLTKRGKNFGGWKTRYFILNESVLEYYESKDGSQLGSIRLTNAQIGTQMQGASTDDSNSVYRHAFLIVEQKRVGSTHSVRHILCANSDDDRDSWVHALLQNINIEQDESFQHRQKKKSEKVRKLSKGEIRAVSAQPISNLKLENAADLEKLTSVPTITTDESRPTPSISSESDTSSNWTSEVGRGSLERGLQTPKTIVRRSSMGNLSENPKEEHQQLFQRAVSPTIIYRTDDTQEESSQNEKKARNKAHRMTFWGKKMLFKEEEGLQALQQPPRPSQSSSNTTATSLRGFLSRSSHEQNGQRGKHSDEPLPGKSGKQVFGVSLEEAVRISRVSEMYELPAVVYRCIEFLDAKNAVMEEGLYRLSGSNSTMKALRERFNQEGDVNLLASKEDYDVHVVAGLLKMWLRELPTSVLTREHRVEFLHVIDLLDRKDRVNELGRLVSVLPLANYTLLRALTAHLIRVVQNSDVNKMTMRNVSIVFSPTLGIPATIFNLFMSEFDYIFWTTKDGDAAPRMIEDEEEAEGPVAENEAEGSGDRPSSDGTQRKTTLRLKEEHGRSNRNSVNYMDGAPNAIVDLEKHMEGPPVLDEDEDDDVDDLTLSNDSNYSLNN